MATGIALGDLYEATRTWLLDKVRVDGLTFNNPDTLHGQTYPPNVLEHLPARSISYEVVSSAFRATAEIRFNVIYRFNRTIPQHALPLGKLHNLLNNVYMDAVAYPGSISRAVRNIKTPDRGTDIIVGREEGGTDKDWLALLQFQFEMEFTPAKGDVDGIQPPTPDNEAILHQLTIATYRSIAETQHQDHRLDKEIIINYED